MDTTTTSLKLSSNNVALSPGAVTCWAAAGSANADPAGL
jgi:hypothetical protein